MLLLHPRHRQSHLQSSIILFLPQVFSLLWLFLRAWSARIRPIRVARLGLNRSSSTYLRRSRRCSRLALPLCGEAWLLRWTRSQPILAHMVLLLFSRFRSPPAQALSWRLKSIRGVPLVASVAKYVQSDPVVTSVGERPSISMTASPEPCWLIEPCFSPVLLLVKGLDGPEPAPAPGMGLVPVRPARLFGTAILEAKS